MESSHGKTTSTPCASTQEGYPPSSPLGPGTWVLCITTDIPKHNQVNIHLFSWHIEDARNYVREIWYSWADNKCFTKGEGRS
ncbi:hypothetical protein KDA_49420 [Dictyobacter alpinus]|uniref:Uncharacterized protein n=1 Tax=Dictyobacter alpinus TaxID=2014873 RepID=A0A402BDH8_9CHLR|nr:hypothetical protein KDA_49420 [Dictyobacter alpinus]